jgi:hypothetical protein
VAKVRRMTRKDQFWGSKVTLVESDVIQRSRSGIERRDYEVASTIVEDVEQRDDRDGPSKVERR